MFTHLRNHAIAVELVEARQISHLNLHYPYWFYGIHVRLSESELLAVVVYRAHSPYVPCLGLELICNIHELHLAVEQKSARCVLAIR